ncbi:unnamed protein product [Meloidogyne enterolobii]|uniref:Uncharacterized protein n=1 Tax=Meloidogyne enterolobii TaxID=390850 RepID=A0ACB0ZPS4_MELEN
MAHLPPKDEYLCNGMMPSKRQQFDIWYEEHKNDTFFLNEALASYCSNDVDILLSALIKFRKEFFDVSRKNGGFEGIIQIKNFKILCLFSNFILLLLITHF